jgi:hypothetical protein
MKRILAAVALVSLFAGAASAQKITNIDTSGAEASFPELTVTLGYGAGIPGVSHALARVETEGLVPGLWTDSYFRYGIDFGIFEDPNDNGLFPLAYPITGFRQRVGLSLRSDKPKQQKVITSVSSSGNTTTQNFFMTEMPTASLTTFFGSAEMRFFPEPNAQYIFLGGGLMTQNRAYGDVKFTMGGENETREVSNYEQDVYEPRIVLGKPGQPFGWGFAWSKSFAVAKFCGLPIGVGWEVGAYYMEGFDFSDPFGEGNFLLDGMIDITIPIGFDLFGGKKPEPKEEEPPPPPEEPKVDEPTPPTTEEPKAEEPKAEEPAADPAAEEPKAEEPATDEKKEEGSDEEKKEEASEEKPAEEKPAEEKPAEEKPAEEPAPSDG